MRACYPHIFHQSDLKSWLADLSDPGARSRLKDKMGEKSCPTDSISDGKELMEDVGVILALSDGVSTSAKQCYSTLSADIFHG